jgi:NAD(P)-dependent dehydrogenase (short-subunit alcohol dehydrogenase family)
VLRRGSPGPAGGSAGPPPAPGARSAQGAGSCPRRRAPEEVAGMRGGRRVVAADVTDPRRPTSASSRTCPRWAGSTCEVNTPARASRATAGPDRRRLGARSTSALSRPHALMRAAAPRMAARAAGGSSTSARARASARRSRTPLLRHEAASSRCRASSRTPTRPTVLVNAVAPGPVASELWTGPAGWASSWPRSWETGERCGARRPSPARPPGEPDEVADVIVFLVLPRASTVTGAACVGGRRHGATIV